MPDKAGGSEPAGTSNKVLVGEIVAAHGIRGAVKLKSYTADPAAIADYCPLTDQTGRRSFRLKVVGMAKTTPIAEVEGVRDRNAAEALRGTRLYVDRDRLPPTEEDEFYHADLIGLPVATVAGEPFGKVLAVYDFGAGDMLEIRMPDGRVVHMPFTKAAVPVVDVRGGRIVVDPPAGFLEPPEPPPGGRPPEVDDEGVDREGTE